MPISTPNPVFDNLLESSHRDDSNKWSNIGFGEEITQVKSIEVQFKLLCVSCTSATEFSAILFLLLAPSSSNSPQLLEGFRRTLVQNFIKIQQWVKIFPIDPHCKNWPLSATL